MIALGINALNHDAAVCLVDTSSRDILYAAHSERYSRLKNDSQLSPELVEEIQRHKVDHIYWHGNPWLKSTREIFSGEPLTCFKHNPSGYLKGLGLNAPLSYVNHHESHAAAGYFTSKFKEAAVVVADAIGEWDTLSIWKGEGTSLKRQLTLRYPSSLGLLYSAFTQRVGLKPNEEEYILMGMAAFGDPYKYLDIITKDFLEYRPMKGYLLPCVKKNVHLGIGDYLPNAKPEDLAASIQRLTEDVMQSIFRIARSITGSLNLVYQGGVSLNCVANLPAYSIFDQVWIMPNPGDAGGSLGAIAARTGFLSWKSPYLGYNIPGNYPVEGALLILKESGVVGVACGKAEFGPRALGNRSLLADPRGPNVKNLVNTYKHRQKFRPFAPVILEELAPNFFKMPTSSLPYMQLTVPCRYPKDFPAIVHVDGSSRVQTVNITNNPGLYNLLKRFYQETGCPMLLNTSLNIKGEPLVNTVGDAKAFTEKHQIPVLSGDL